MSNVIDCTRLELSTGSKHCAQPLDRISGEIAAAGLETPFFYVAGIVDRVGLFSEDVSQPPYAQNNIGSHNAGVVLANIMDRLERFYKNL